jgi:probable phosphoglycerate mutase
MSTRLLLVRHGQTDWNREERYRGHTDLPLNAVGKRQAEAVARRIGAEFRPAAVYCGPLERTRDTGAAIARVLGVSLQIEPDLIDLDYGHFAGLSPAEAEANFPQAYRTWIAAPDAVRLPGGESLTDVRSRATYLVTRLAQRHSEEQVVLVTHQDVIRVLLCDWLGLHLGHIRTFQVQPASLSVVDAGPHDLTIVTLNDTSHLAAVLHDGKLPKLGGEAIAGKNGSTPADPSR